MLLQHIAACLQQPGGRGVMKYASVANLGGEAVHMFYVLFGASLVCCLLI